MNPSIKANLDRLTEEPTILDYVLLTVNVVDLSKKELIFPKLFTGKLIFSKLFTGKEIMSPDIQDKMNEALLEHHKDIPGIPDWKIEYVDDNDESLLNLIREKTKESGENSFISEFSEKIIPSMIAYKDKGGLREEYLHEKIMFIITNSCLSLDFDRAIKDWDKNNESVFAEMCHIFKKDYGLSDKQLHFLLNSLSVGSKFKMSNLKDFIPKFCEKLDEFQKAFPSVKS